jgi:uncharacterized membrane protein
VHGRIIAKIVIPANSPRLPFSSECAFINLKNGIVIIYLIIKTGHIVAVFVWVGGMLAVAALLAALRPTEGTFLLPEARLLEAARRWQRRAVTPAMLVALGLGLTLAHRGHWFAAGWLHAKLMLALGLAALHGVLAASLRRIAAKEVKKKPSAALRFAPAGLLAAVAAIVALVVLKPF